MQITLEIPDDVTASLGGDPQTIARLTLEALALEGIRTGRLTEYEARIMLGISNRFEMDGFLKAHGVDLDMSYEEVMEGVANSQRFRAAQACVS
ncbi:hypothetical protein F183_A38510 [Bryobacterales bacterium F-183]|nr:hypothetical protein F183_A38510 [Bryobacterales bacterium F-183]